jgi:hypothetical protein
MRLAWRRREGEFVKTHVLSACLALFALVGVGVAVAPGAGASSAIQVYGAGNGASPGLVRVAFFAPTPVSSISVSVRDPQTNAVDASVTQFTAVNGASGVFDSTGRVQLPALGDYPLDVTVSDTGGDIVTMLNAGVLGYNEVAQIDSFTASSTTVNILHHQVTFTGRLVGEMPGSGLVVPIPNVAIELFANTQGVVSLPQTDTSGKFSVTADIQSGDAVHGR